MLFNRSNLTEIMDDFSIKDEKIDLAFNELKNINKYFGGNSTSIEGIKKVLNKFINGI